MSGVGRKIWGCCFVLLASSGAMRAQSVQGARFDSVPVLLEKSGTKRDGSVTPMDLLTLRDPEGLSISPDGRYVAFVVGQAVYQANGYRSGLFVVRTSGQHQVRSLGSAGWPHWDEINQWIPEAPTWSLDSRVIWYRMRSEERANWQVWGWNLASGTKKQITQIAGDVENYSVVAGGSSLFLTVLGRRRADENAESYHPGIPFGAQFHPYQSIPILVQRREAEGSNPEYWIHDLRTDRERRATLEEVRRWKPAEPAAVEGNHGTEPEAVAPYHLLEAKESPDGRHVAYLYAVDDPSVERLWSRRLLLFSKQTQKANELTPNAYFIDQLWWDEDGSALYFTEREGRGRSPKLWRVGPDGASVTLVFEAAGGSYFSSFSPDKALRYFAGLLENNISPPQIALLDSTTKEVRTLVDLNPGYLGLDRSPAERIEGTNRFGESWFAYLVKPLGYLPGTRYPLIITTYRSGDYFLRGASGDQNPIQVYAANGFAVLSFDVGLKRNRRPGQFADKIEDWAHPTASMESATGELERAGLIDRNRVGIAGFSHGEEIAGFALTHTDLFHAAIGAALYDPCFYFLGGTEWWEVFESWGLGGWPGGKSKLNWQQIDMTVNADRIRAPLLENASDTEFLIYMPIYRSLLDLGKPVDLYIYPQELHVRNQPKHRLEIYERNLDWFRFWLKQEEDPDRAKREQYLRWRHLREAPIKTPG